MRAVVVDVRTGQPVQHHELGFGVLTEALQVGVTLQPDPVSGQVEPALVIAVDTQQAIRTPMQWIDAEAFR